MSLTYHSVGRTTGTPAGVTIGAETNVDIYQNYFTGIANDAIDKLNLEIDSLQNLDWNPQGFVAEAGAVNPFGLIYTPPTNIPKWDFALDMPEYTVPDPKLQVVDPEVDAYKPDPFTDKAEAIVTPIIPGALEADIPSDIPIVRDIVIPDVPEMGNIPDPVIRAITIPTLAALDYPEFNERRPDANSIDVPDGDFQWSETDYDSTILQGVQSTISDFLAGGVGIPDYVWDRIWNRGRDKQERSSRKLVTEITEEFAAKGFDLPQGAQIARIDEALKATHDSVSELNRELVIKQAEHEIENLKFAVTQGTALENMIGGWYQNRMTRALDAAKYTIQASIEIFNAEVSLYNTNMQAYSIAAQVYKIELEAELAQLEEHKLRLEASKLTNDINLQEVQIYKTRIDAYAVQVNAFESEVKAIATTVDVDRTRMEAYKAQVSAYAALVQAKSVEYDGYKAQWEGETAKIGLFEAQVRAYGSQVGAYKTEVDASVAEKEIRLKINDEQFKKFSASLEGHNAETKTELARLEAASKEFESNAKSFELEAGTSKDVLGALVADYKLAIQHSGQVTQAAISSAGNLTAATTAENELLKTTAEIMARAYSQLAASAMSVVSVSASISDSASNSSSESLSYDGGQI